MPGGVNFKLNYSDSRVRVNITMRAAALPQPSLVDPGLGPWPMK